MSHGTDPHQRSSVVAWSLLIVLALLMYFVSLGSYHTLGSHEVIAAVPAREMLQSGDWVVPRYGDVPRVQKPPLVYWLVALSAEVFGGFDEFSVRVPSALAALGLVALLSLWAGRWYGREAAFGAALVQTTSLWAINYGRRAEIDMVMCLLTTAAMFLIATQPVEEPPSRARWRWTGILTLIGVTWLAKFQYGSAMVFGPVFVFWIVQRRWRAWRNLVNPLGVLLVAACAVIWPYLLFQQFPEALERIRVESIGRATGEMRHGVWWYYLVPFLGFSLPWTGHVVWAMPQSWRRAWRHGDERERLVWLWLLVDLAIISLTSNKHRNYLLAAMPATTLLASQTFARLLAMLHREQLRIPKFVAPSIAMSGVVAAAAIGVLAPSKWPHVLTGIVASCVVVASGLVVAAWFWSHQRRTLAGWASLVSLAAVFLVFVTWVTPGLDRRRDAVEFARAVRHDVLRDQPVCAYLRSGVLPGFHPAIYYLDEPVFQVRTFSELLQHVQSVGELFAVVERSTLPRFDAVRSAIDVEEITQPAFPPGSGESPLVCVRLKSVRRPHGDDTAWHEGGSDRR